MKSKTVAQPRPADKASAPKRPGRIHPVVIYPFHQPTDFSDLEALYHLVACLADDDERYARPITVLDRKTHYSTEGSKAFLDFRKGTVARSSDILEGWFVDTCQMWYAGLGLAFERGEPEDVYWLIPGDFNYGAGAGQEVLGRLHDLPEVVMELEQDFCVGEITTDYSHSKQLIDTYATFALLYNWFPAEAQELRRLTERPRSEFFALRHGFLQDLLRQRWYAYEQTVVMLLNAVFSGRRISRFLVGSISDLPEGRDSLASAIQQMERTERVLKSLWLERHQARPGWAAEYVTLINRSDNARRTAMTVLASTLG
jgi:hypothetical protein